MMRRVLSHTASCKKKSSDKDSHTPTPKPLNSSGYYRTSPCNVANHNQTKHTLLVLLPFFNRSQPTPQVVHPPPNPRPGWRALPSCAISSPTSRHTTPLCVSSTHRVINYQLSIVTTAVRCCVVIDDCTLSSLSWPATPPDHVHWSCRSKRGGQDRSHTQAHT